MNEPCARRLPAGQLEPYLANAPVFVAIIATAVRMVDGRSPSTGGTTRC
jgi:hypothetical protein